MATIGANLAHGLGHGPVGAVVSAWPALALAGSFELLMALIRTDQEELAVQSAVVAESQRVPVASHDARAALEAPPTLEQTIRAWHNAGRSQRAIARELNIDRRKVKRIIDLAG